MNNKNGFTILELLIVISVLAILIGIAMPRIKGFMDNAKVVQTKSELKSMQAALQSYYTFSTPNAYPPSTTTVGASYLVNAQPKIISNVLYDPFVGNGGTTEYNYLRSSNGKYFVVYSVGLNGSSSSVAISNTGAATRLEADDWCATNGNGCEEGALLCYSGYTKCSGVCVNLQTDINNCGSCGNFCGDPNDGWSCSGGICFA